MSRILLVALAALALAPAAAQARPGDPDNRFGRRGTVTLKAIAADAVGGAVKVLSGNRVLAGGSGRGPVRRGQAAPDRLAGQHVRHERPGRARRCRARRWTACGRSRRSATAGSSPPERS